MGKVSLEQLRKSYGADHDPTKAINGLDLDIEPGEFFVLLGPSGCGKTTTLRCIAGLENPDSGRISIGQRLVADPANAVLVAPHLRDIGMVFQSYALWPHMTLEQNVAYPLKARQHLKGKALRQRSLEALEQVGLAALAERYPSQLSGGQQQRVALARALAAAPQLLLFDEPLSNLDAQLRLHLRQELRSLQRRSGHTAIYVTHDQSEALALADRIAVMRQGRLEQLGPPEAIHERPASRFVASFVGFDNFIAGRIVEVQSKSLLVSTELGVFKTQADQPLPVGSAVEVACRSSALRVSRQPSSAQALPFEVRIEDLSYQGDRYEAWLQVGQARLKASLWRHDWPDAPEPGSAAQSLFIEFPADKLVAVPMTHPE